MYVYTRYHSSSAGAGAGRWQGTHLLLGLLLITAFVIWDDDPRSILADVLSTTCRLPLILLLATGCILSDYYIVYTV
jgi:hypothetical protein